MSNTLAERIAATERLIGRALFVLDDIAIGDQSRESLILRVYTLNDRLDALRAAANR